MTRRYRNRSASQAKDRVVQGLPISGKWHDPQRIRVVIYRYRSDVSHDKNHVMRILLKIKYIVLDVHWLDFNIYSCCLFNDLLHRISIFDLSAGTIYYIPITAARLNQGFI